ncbi:MAG: hypothetical protein ACM31D_00390 [Bacteroidota bacterium]
MNKAVVGFVAGAVVVGAAGFATLVYPQMRAKQKVDASIAALPKDVQARYQTLDYSLFSGKLVIGGLEMTVQDGADTVTTKLSSVSLRNFTAERVGELRGTGITVEAGDGSLRLEADELSGEQMEAAQGLLAGFNATGANAMNIKHMALTGISVTLPGEVVKLREVVIADYVQTDKVPQAMSLGIHGLLVEPQSLPDDDAREALAKLGYDKLSLNFDLSYAHSAANKRLSIKQAAIGGDGLGQLSIAMDLGGVDPNAINDPILAMAAAQAATLESMELRYDDASLAGRILKLAASEAEMEEAQFKAMLLAQLAEAGAQAPATPLTKEMLDSATAFLTSPKSLSLRLKPAQPMPLAQIMGNAQDPVALAQAMGMSVSANR